MNISGTSITGNIFSAGTGVSREGGVSRSAASSGTSRSAQQMSPDEQTQVSKLKERDRVVRQHELAHMAAGAGLTSAASFTYQRGPDGVNYAVGGEVGIDTSPGRSPDETIRKARQIQAAALAPSDPSGQDHAVAAQAVQMEQQAQLEKSRQADAETGSTSGHGVSALARAYATAADSLGRALNDYA